MRLYLEADPEELREKSPELVGELAKALREHSPEIADILEKAAAIPKAPPELRHRALRDIHDHMRAEYKKMTGRMVEEIADTIDEHTKPKLQKARPPNSPDYIAPVLEKEEKSYKKMQSLFAPYGYSSGDFEEGGRLYGKSMRELGDMLAALRAKK